MRFRRRGEINFLVRRGARIRTELGRVAWARATQGRGRILFIVSGAVARRAARRNRIRRELEEQARRGFAARASRVDVVILVDPAVAALTRSARAAAAARARGRSAARGGRH